MARNTMHVMTFRRIAELSEGSRYVFMAVKICGSLVILVKDVDDLKLDSPAYEFSRILHRKLLQQAPAMAHYREFAHRKCQGHIGCREALGNEIQDLFLCGCY